MSSALLFIILILTSVLPDEMFCSSGVYLYTIVAVFSIALFFISKESNLSIKQVSLRPAHLFILAYFIVFYQRPIDYVLGYVDGWRYIGLDCYMLKCLKISTIGLLSFLIGYMLCSKKHYITKVQHQSTYVVSTKFYSFITSILLFAIIAFVPRTVLRGGYGQELLSSAGTFNYLSSWCSTFIIAFLIQFSINKKNLHQLTGCSISRYIKSIGTWQIVNTLGYAFLVLNVGDRGPLIVVCIAYYFCYAIVSKRRLSKISIAVILLTGMLGSSYLGLTKQYRGNNTFLDRINSIKENGGFALEESICGPTFELSGSYNCLAFSLEMLDKQQDYSYGAIQVASILQTIPFINRIIPLPQSSSYQISHFVQGPILTYGTGTSCVADLYLDGGILLVIIGLFLWGLFLRFFEVSLFEQKNVSLFLYCIAFFFLSHVIYIPRSTILSPLKYSLWIYIIMIAYSKFAARNRA